MRRWLQPPEPFPGHRSRPHTRSAFVHPNRLAPFALLAPFAPLALSPARPLAQQADTVVRVAGAPRHAGIATLVEEISIGVVDGAEEYTFGDVTDVAVGKDGSIYV